MNIVFVAPRVHPNQTPIISGLIARGHNVYYLVQREGNYESHAGASVIKLESTLLSKAFLQTVKRIKGEDFAERKSITYFIPQRKQLKKALEEMKPDVIVVRNRTLLSYAAYREGRKTKAKILLYNQTPIYEDSSAKYVSPGLKKVIASFFPKRRMTVVRYKNYPSEQCTYREDRDAVFIPFVVRETKSVKTKYCENGVIHIFDSGKYRDYKNHFFVVDVAQRLKSDGYEDFRITIQGQVENDEEEEYFQRLEKYIVDKKVSDKVQLLRGVPYEEMENLFLKNDMYILASKSEIANISILDAMMYGLLTISTSTNGTADYILPGKTGEVYPAGNLDELSRVIEYYLDHRENVPEIGKAAHEYVMEHNSFESYYDEFMTMLKSM